MNKTNFKKYLSYVKQKKNVSIEDEILEKDYMISLFLSTWQKQKEQGTITSLDALIFKGGTLLSRNYIDYPRISEDLDFTFELSNQLRTIKSNTRREKEIKKQIIPIIKDIKIISTAAGFDFQMDRTNETYVRVRNSRAVYLFYLYYPSAITGEKIPLKIEINFLEQRLFDYEQERINDIIEDDLYLRSIGYDLINAVLKTYSLDEIILEKYRAVLTRPSLKKRDILDLYFIHTRCKPVLDIAEEDILEKISSSFLISPDAKKNYKENISLMSNNKFITSDDRVGSLLLTKIDEDQFTGFTQDLFEKLKTFH